MKWRLTGILSFRRDSDFNGNDTKRRAVHSSVNTKTRLGKRDSSTFFFSPFTIFNVFRFGTYTKTPRFFNRSSASRSRPYVALKTYHRHSCGRPCVGCRTYSKDTPVPHLCEPAAVTGGNPSLGSRLSLSSGILATFINVSITPWARKSCVTTQKKRETVVTRPTLRGSGMPITVERATSRAHADMDITSPFTTRYTRIEKGCAIYTSRGHLLLPHP